HAGTMNSCNPTVAAALATIQVLEREKPYERMFYLGKKLMDGIRQVAEKYNQNLLVQGLGPMFNVSFTDLDSIEDFRDTFQTDKAKLGRFVAALHNRKIRVIGRGLWYISTAHKEEDVDYAIGK